MKEFIRTHKRVVLLCLAAVLVVAAAIGGTLAWLTSTPNSITNTFVPGEVPNLVTEDPFDGTTKSNVRVQNTGNVDAYIRVALVPIWRNVSDNNGAGIAATLSQLTFTGFPGTKWTEGTDGYYYYEDRVTPGASTEALIGTAKVNVTHEGKYLELQILSQSIQADGMGAESAQEAFAIGLDATTENPGA